VGIFERAKKILAVADYYFPGMSWLPHCFDRGFSCRTLYLYFILIAEREEKALKGKNGSRGE
jgi:hypothetical protein